MNKEAIFQIERPDNALLTYFFLSSLAGLIAMPVIFIPLYFKFQTLRYRFDEKGIAMSWGILFRREIYLTYKKIQDIHLTRNLVERYMGLGKLHIQTASGSAGSEMVILGIPHLESMRDFIYRQMKGFEDAEEGGAGELSAHEAEKLLVLTKIHDQLERLNATLEARRV